MVTHPSFVRTLTRVYTDSVAHPGTLMAMLLDLCALRTGGEPSWRLNLF